MFGGRTGSWHWQQLAMPIYSWQAANTYSKHKHWRQRHTIPAAPSCTMGAPARPLMIKLQIAAQSTMPVPCWLCSIATKQTRRRFRHVHHRRRMRGYARRPSTTSSSLCDLETPLCASALADRAHPSGRGMVRLPTDMHHSVWIDMVDAKLLMKAPTYPPTVAQHGRTNDFRWRRARYCVHTRPIFGCPRGFSKHELQEVASHCPLSNTRKQTIQHLADDAQQSGILLGLRPSHFELHFTAPGRRYNHA